MKETTNYNKAEVKSFFQLIKQLNRQNIAQELLAKQAPFKRPKVQTDDHEVLYPIIDSAPMPSKKSIFLSFELQAAEKTAQQLAQHLGLHIQPQAKLQPAYYQLLDNGVAIAAKQRFSRPDDYLYVVLYAISHKMVAEMRPSLPINQPKLRQTESATR